jgi:hypothetical protein
MKAEDNMITTFNGAVDRVMNEGGVAEFPSNMANNEGIASLELHAFTEPPMLEQHMVVISNEGNIETELVDRVILSAGSIVGSHEVICIKPPEVTRAGNYSDTGTHRIFSMLTNLALYGERKDSED